MPRNCEAFLLYRLQQLECITESKSETSSSKALTSSSFTSCENRAPIETKVQWNVVDLVIETYNWPEQQRSATIATFTAGKCKGRSKTSNPFKTSCVRYVTVVLIFNAQHC